MRLKYMRLSFALWVEETSRDAAPVDIEYDFSYDSSVCREDSDYWHHHSAAGTVTRFHVTELRARIGPTSVKGCPVHPSLLSDARITSAMTDGTEFTLQDNWRAKDSRTLPCRWTGTTVFNTAKTKVKVSYGECAAPAEENRLFPKWILWSCPAVHRLHYYPRSILCQGSNRRSIYKCTIPLRAMI